MEEIHNIFLYVTILFLISGGLLFFVSVLIVHEFKRLSNYIFYTSMACFILAVVCGCCFHHFLEKFKVQSYKTEIIELIKDDYENQADVETEIGAIFDGVENSSVAKMIAIRYKRIYHDRMFNSYHDVGNMSRKHLYTLVDKQCTKMYFKHYLHIDEITAQQREQYQDELTSCKEGLYNVIDKVLEQKGITQDGRR